MAYDRNKYARTGSGSTSGSSGSSQTGRSSSTVRSGKYQKNASAEKPVKTDVSPQYSSRQNSYKPKTSTTPAESVVIKENQTSGGYAAYKKQKEAQGRASEQKVAPVYPSPTTSALTLTDTAEEFHYDTTPISPDNSATVSQPSIPQPTVVDSVTDITDSFSKFASVSRIISIISGLTVIIMCFPAWIAYHDLTYSPITLFSVQNVGAIRIIATVFTIITIILQLLNAIMQVKRIKGFRWVGMAAGILSAVMTLLVFITFKSIVSYHESMSGTGFKILEWLAGGFIKSILSLNFWSTLFFGAGTAVVGVFSLAISSASPSIAAFFPIFTLLVAIVQIIFSFFSGRKISR